MELKDRIAAVRRAAGLTQEQLGELVGVTRQAVSKWEAGQAVPDAVTIAALCEALHVSADYVLLGREPEEDSDADTAPAYLPPDTCPCCGREVSGSLCPVCGFPLPTVPPRGPRYALIASSLTFYSGDSPWEDLVRYCGFTEEGAKAAVEAGYGIPILVRRDLSDTAVQYIASHIRCQFFELQIVEDCGESEDALLAKRPAMETPPSAQEKASSEGLGFWGVVGAVLVAMLILSFL